MVSVGGLCGGFKNYVDGWAHLVVEIDVLAGFRREKHDADHSTDGEYRLPISSFILTPCFRERLSLCGEGFSLKACV